MNRVLPIAQLSAFFSGSEELRQQRYLNLLDERKMSWSSFEKKIKNISTVRLCASKTGRTLLHLAVLDRRLSVIQELSSDLALKHKADKYGLSPIDLAKFLGFREALEYLSSSAVLDYPIFENREVLETVLAETDKAKKNGEISPEKIWLGIYYDREIGRGFHPPIQVRFIDDVLGHGVFSRERISPCDYVGEYIGRVEKVSERKLKGKRYCLRYAIANKRFTLNAETEGNFTRYINHSSKPNLGLQSVYWRGVSRKIFVALKEILQGEQLTFDYGDAYWKELRQIPVEI